MTNETERFRILVCVDGSEESYRGLKYAAKVGSGVDADICLLYVRPIDQGLGSGGLQVDVARQNMMDWGIELPGITYLKKGRDILCDLGALGEGWSEQSQHTDVQGSSMGDNKIVYTDKDTGKEVILKLKVSHDIATGVLDQWEIGHYDLIIIGASGQWTPDKVFSNFWNPAIAEKVAMHAPCSVLVARDLDPGQGHLICTDGSDKANEMLQADAALAHRCNCDISVMSVSHDVEGQAEAQDIVDHAMDTLKAMDITAVESMVRVGNPIDEIVEAGAGYSLIVLSDTGKGGLERFFMGSVSLKVMQKARNSVMIAR